MSPTHWNLNRWDTFKWGLSDEFSALLDAKTNNEPRMRLIWHLDAGDQDITKYFLSGAAFAQEKERPPARLTAGDTTVTLDNSSGVFTELSSSSFLYGVNYHNRKISLEIGLELKDGSIEYFKIATMLVSDVSVSSDNNQVVIHLYDAISKLLNDIVNQTPAGLASSVVTGTGNGTMTAVATLPLTTKTENWTLTCTLGGADGVATFSVVGSISGNVGTATSGTEFSNRAAGGLKFTISVGNVNWVIGDTVTFSTTQTMEWTAANPVKIMWSILTGYNWDTNVQDPWYSRSEKLDPTQSSTNTDLDYSAWANAITVAAQYFTLTGFIPWDYNLADALQEINLPLLGAFPVDVKGRLSIKIYAPELTTNYRDFADTKKVVQSSVIRDTRDVINKVTFTYRKSKIFPWSDEDQVQTLDGNYVATNTDSYAALNNTWYGQDFSTRWYNATADHVVYAATRILDKYGRPPRRFSINTGIDGIDTEIGDIASVTDAKQLFNQYQVEVMKKELNADQLPISVMLTMEDTGTYGIAWAFLGSSGNEGDGISPQAADFGSASVSDKNFCYLSTTGAVVDPRYYLF